MAMATGKIMNLRINPDTEEELYHFIKGKGGLKKTILYLYRHYQMTQRVDDIVDRLAKEIDYTPKPTQSIMEAVELDDEVVNMAFGFLK